MKNTKGTEFQVIIPKWESKYEKSKKTMAKYWLWKDRLKLPKKHLENLASKSRKYGVKLYCVDKSGNRFLKNSKKAGTPNTWTLNGQDLYSAVMHHTVRTKMAKYYHAYFKRFIISQLPSKIPIILGYKFGVSCDIYEIKRGIMPDVSNMWLLEKFFEDALQEAGRIPDDNPDYVIESGRKRYHWVEKEDKRKLVFTIYYLKDDVQ